MEAAKRLRSGESPMDICSDMKISMSSLYRWKRMYASTPDGSVEGMIHRLQKNPQEDSGYFMTVSIPCAAALMLHGFKVDRIEDPDFVKYGDKAKKRIFFKDEPGLRSIVDAYFSGSLDGNLRSYWDHIYHLRKAVFGPVVS